MELLTSIIVATKNNRLTIRHLLKSLRKFSEKYPTEAIIVDGKSSDGTYNIIKEFTTRDAHLFHRILAIQDLGTSLSYARYLGFINSTGDIVIFLDGDMVLHNSFINHFKDVINNEYDLVTPGWIILGLDPVTKTFHTLSTIVGKVSLDLSRPSLLTPARIFKREALNLIHGYPPLSRYTGEDRVATSLAVLKGLKYAFIPKLKIIKIDETHINSYIRKHIRYGEGINKDLTPVARRLLRDYILARRITYTNLILPAISAIYAAYAFRASKSISESLRVFAMKYIIDLSMLLGELKSLVRK